MFRDSAVYKTEKYGTISYSTAMPERIYPVYIGSGKCVMSIDATGAQGLNNRAQKAFHGMPNSADMYVVGQAMVGNVLSAHNTLPYGYVDYITKIDQIVYDAETLSDNASVWSRRNDIFSATVDTEFIVASVVCVKIRTYIPYGSECCVFEVETSSYDFMRGATDTPHVAEFNFRLHLTTRGGKPVFNTVTREGDIFLCKVKGHETYEKIISAENSQNNKIQYSDDTISVSMKFLTGRTPQKQTILFSFDGKKHLADLRGEYAAHLSFWKDYYENCAGADFRDTKAEFLYNNSLYLFKMGYEPNKGLPIGHPFFFPWCWEQSTFWDSHFVCDAMMRAGRIREAGEFLGFLGRTIRKVGKAYPWMFIYDGTTFLDPSRDNAPHCIAAHAMTAIKYYEYTLDEKALQNACYPIISRCVETALAIMFRKEENGRWIVSLPVSNDVVDSATEINQTFTTVWFLSIIKKYTEYSEKLGKTADERCYDILKNYYLENNGCEYLNSRGIKAEVCGSWLPFLAYPTEGIRFLDRKLLDNTLDKYTYVDLYMEHQNSFQPWTEAIEAQAMHRAGRYERAHILMNAARDHSYGDGYFCEIGPQQQTVGFPPYISAHGSYASCYLDTIINVSIWEKEGCVFTYLPEEYRGRKVTAQGILSAGNILLERADYSPERVFCKLKGRLEGYRFNFALPVRKREKYCVYLNGSKVSDIVSDENYVTLTFPREENAYEIEIK